MTTTEHTKQCRHEESLYGRCTRCGITWDEQARAVEQTPADLAPLWDAALPADAPGAWIRAAIDRLVADA